MASLKEYINLDQIRLGGSPTSCVTLIDDMRKMRRTVSMKTKGHQQIERENVWTNFLSPPTLRSEYISFCRTNPPKTISTFN